MVVNSSCVEFSRELVLGEVLLSGLRRFSVGMRESKRLKFVSGVLQMGQFRTVLSLGSLEAVQVNHKSELQVVSSWLS